MWRVWRGGQKRDWCKLVWLPHFPLLYTSLLSHSSPILFWIASSDIILLFLLFFPFLHFFPNIPRLSLWFSASLSSSFSNTHTHTVWLTTEQLQSSIAFLPVNPTLSPLRNQGRQKLATLDAQAFAQLVVDLLVDTKRRQNLSLETGTYHTDSVQGNRWRVEVWI